MSPELTLVTPEREPPGAASRRRCLPAKSFALGIGLIGTVLAAGKDALARAYVSHATRPHVPTLDLSRLFAGTENPGQVA